PVAERPTGTGLRDRGEGRVVGHRDEEPLDVHLVAAAVWMVALAIADEVEVADPRDQRLIEPVRGWRRSRDRADPTEARAGHERGRVEPVELVGVQVGHLGGRVDGEGRMAACDVETERRRARAGARSGHLQPLTGYRG